MTKIGGLVFYLFVLNHFKQTLTEVTKVQSGLTDPGQGSVAILWTEILLEGKFSFLR